MQFLEHCDQKSLLLCPNCCADIIPDDAGFCCPLCDSNYPIKDGILCGVAPHQKTNKDVTDLVKSFYEEYPFPDYGDLDDLDSLRLKARGGLFAKALDDQLPRHIDVLECGCGTGQLTNFLASGSRNVFGTDICINSLSLGNRFRQKNRIERARFIQMNLFKPIFKDKKFDLVICNGVLHHTSDPKGGLESIGSLVKPGGFIIVGLYNRFDRLGTDMRRLIFRLTKGRLMFLDPVLRKNISHNQRIAWFKDQYEHPHERKFTFYQIRKWCADMGFTVVNTLPKTLIGDVWAPDEPIFQRNELAGSIESFLVELSRTFIKSNEGGLMMVIAKRLDDHKVSS